MASTRLSDCRHPWPGVEVRHLATLAAIARTRSFGGAASDLGYVQSAVSQHISDLERVVGTRLVERCSGHRTVRLTRAGEVLLDHGRAIIAQLRAARADLATLESAATGTVRVGFCQGVAPTLLPRFAPAVTRRLPEVRLQLTEVVDDDELPALLERGEIDLAFGPGDSRFECRPLLRDPFVLLVAADSPLALRTAPPSPPELAELPLILPLPSHGFAQAEAQLVELGVDVSTAVRSPTTAAIQAFVAAGLGAAVVPGISVGRADPATVAISLEGLVLPRALMLSWHRERCAAPLIEQVAEVVLGALEGFEAEAHEASLAA